MKLWIKNEVETEYDYMFGWFRNNKILNLTNNSAFHLDGIVKKPEFFGYTKEYIKDLFLSYGITQSPTYYTNHNIIEEDEPDLFEELLMLGYNSKALRIKFSYDDQCMYVDTDDILRNSNIIVNFLLWCSKKYTNNINVYISDLNNNSISTDSIKKAVSQLM